MRDDGTDSHDLTVVGWKEYAALPDWGVKRIRAKIDTGARTSAVHVSSWEMIDDDHVRFEIVVREKPTVRTRTAEAEIVRESKVKPSSGEVQRRPVVRTMLRLGDVAFEAELNLVERTGMTCRMLIGRTALADRFLVDSSRPYVVSSRVRPKKGVARRRPRTNETEQS